MEIEAKYRINSDATYTVLKSLTHVGEYTLATGHTLAFRDIYYDTEDHHLLSAGYALRERRYPDNIVLTVKSLSPSTGNLHKREEFETQSPDLRIDHPGTWPDKNLSDRIWAITGGSPLQPLFELNQDRFLRAVLHKDIAIAELCIDHVHCQIGEASMVYQGLEVELAPEGSENDLQTVCRSLENIAELIPEKQSKFEIGLTFTQVPAALLVVEKASKSPAPKIHWRDDMATAAYKAMRYHILEMKRNDAGSFRGQDIEYIHDMRVAVRRVRAALKVFAPHIDPIAVEPLRKTLKKTGRILGTVRDLDVFRENFEAYAETQQLDIQNSTLTAAWNTAYRSGRSRLTKYLGSDRYLLFRASCPALFKHIISTNTTCPSVADQLWSTLEEQRTHVFESFNLIQLVQPIPMHQYHQLRITLKYFRYSLEYFRTLLGKRGESVISETKLLQNHLGALQDAVVARKQIMTVQQWGMWETPHQPYTLLPQIQQPSADVKAYLSHTQAEIKRLVDTFPDVWNRFNDFIINFTYKKPRNTL